MFWLQCACLCDQIITKGMLRKILVNILTLHWPVPAPCRIIRRWHHRRLGKGFWVWPNWQFALKQGHSLHAKQVCHDCKTKTHRLDHPILELENIGSRGPVS